MIFHYPFKTFEKKSLYEAVEVITKFYRQISLKAERTFNIPDIVSNAMSETKQEFQTLNFGIKMQKFSIPSPEGNNAVRMIHTQIH
jgi:hypothetical protein